LSDSSATIATFVAACYSLHKSAEAIATAAADHLHLSPDDITWAHAEHADRLAQALEVLVGEVKAFGGAQ
jgi:hypothetical protein